MKLPRHLLWEEELGCLEKALGNYREGRNSPSCLREEPTSKIAGDGDPALLFVPGAPPVSAEIPMPPRPPRDECLGR